MALLLAHSGGQTVFESPNSSDETTDIIACTRRRACMHACSACTAVPQGGVPIEGRVPHWPKGHGQALDARAWWALA